MARFIRATGFVGKSSALLLLCIACTPLRDLDATAAGLPGGTGGFTSGASDGRVNSGGMSGGRAAKLGGNGGWAPANAGDDSGGTTTSGSPANATGGASGLGGQAPNGSGGAPTGGTPGSGGTLGLGGGNVEGGSTSGGSTAGAGSDGVVVTGGTAAVAGGGSGGASMTAPDLPNDIPNSPVSGEIVYSTDATWMVDGVAQPTFEVHTPTASYWLVKSLGSIVSITDASSTKSQWIAYSSNFRPLRGVPGFGVVPGVTTLLDVESQTLTHLRLSCRSGADWQWVWDFYLTHVTLTVNSAPGAYAFSYRGVPGGALDDADRLVLSSGVVQGAKNSYSGDFAGPIEWAYLVDTALSRSLFMIQHSDDDLPERYQVKDSDSALLSFGDGALVRTPQRFSLGLIDSGAHSTVEQRVAFIVAAIH